MLWKSHFCSLVLASAILSFASAQEVIVRPGDTLWDLARRHGTTVEELQAANALVGHALQPGMVLSLPGGADPAPASYTVKTGDTLYDIAVAFDVSIDKLIAYNNLEGTVIRPGQVLSLVSPAVEPPALTVTVEPGDSLWRIARSNDVSVAALAAANGIREDAILQPGNTLSIPGRFAGSSQDQGGAVAEEVTILPGDNLWVIARRHQTTVSALMAANELRDTNIRAGDRLRIVPGTDLVRAALPATPAPQAGVMLWPVAGEITSRFGYRQLRIGGTNVHYGIDIDAEAGEPIRAAVAGVVTYSGWQGGFGNLVIVQNADTEYYYAHASALLVDVGDKVEAGEIIAKVGATGRVTGTHLHFEIRVDGTPVDPLPILQTQAQR